MNGLRFGLRGPDFETDAVGAFAVEFAASVEASFTVDAEAVDRVRDQVLAAFASGAVSLSGHGIRRPSRRLTVASLAASASLMAIAAVVNQSDAGGLLYPTRLGIESAVVPVADSPDGWAVRMHRLQERMHDTIVSARDGEVAAVGMALAEYRIELARLSAAIAVDPSRRDELVAAISADLGLVEVLGRTYHLDAAVLLIADMQALIGSEVAPGGAAPETPAVEGPPGVLPPDDLGAGGPPSTSNAGGNGVGNGPTTNSAGGNGNGNGSANAATNDNAGGNGNGNANTNGSAGSATGAATPAPTVAPAPPAEPVATPTQTHGNAGGNGNGNAGGNGNGSAGGNGNGNGGNGNGNGQADKTPKP